MPSPRPSRRRSEHRRAARSFHRGNGGGRLLRRALGDQRRVIEAGDELIRSMMEKVELDSVETFTIADYGAGTGATSVHAVRGAIGVLRERKRDLPVLAVHNDVPDQRLLTALPQRRRPGRVRRPRRRPGISGGGRGVVLRPGAAVGDPSTPACARTRCTGCASTRARGCQTACTSPTRQVARAKSSPGRPPATGRRSLPPAQPSSPEDGLVLVQGIGSTVSESGEAEVSAPRLLPGHVEGGRRARRGRAAEARDPRWLRALGLLPDGRGVDGAR